MNTFRIALILGLLQTAPAIALDLKGVEIGKPASAAQMAALGLETVPGNVWACVPANAVHTCHGSTRLGSPLSTAPGVFVTTFVTFAADQTVSTIMVRFDPLFFDDLATLAVAKWGKPTKEAHWTEQNAFGALFANIEYDWKMGDGSSVAIFKYLDREHGELELKQ